ncbi:ParD-like family protein [Enterobacter asburiae]|uniref:ParD-like family protein n=1 Tax=Enterobacter chuandaensis TaxID=2497875 RepID=UPI00300C5970
MATSIRLDDDFVSDVKVYADAASRSIPKQIEHWARIGRIAEDNPDLPYSFINEILIAQSEVDNNKVSRYERRTRRKSVTD